MNTPNTESTTFWIPIESSGGLYSAAVAWHRNSGTPIPTAEIREYISKHFSPTLAMVSINGRAFSARIYIPRYVDDHAYVEVNSHGEPIAAARDDSDIDDDQLKAYMRSLRDRWAYTEALAPNERSFIWTEFMHRSLLVKEPGKELRHLNNWRDICGFGRTLLVAPAGAGKTTLLRRLIAEFTATEKSTEKQSTVPIYIQLRDWSNANRIDRLVKSEFSQSLMLPKRKLNDLISSGRMFFLLDGIDEIASEARLNALVDLEEFMKGCTNARVLVTARPGTYLRGLGERMTSCELEPWSHSQIAELCWHKLDGDKTLWRTFWHRIYSERDLLELGRNPLLLSMMLSRYRQSGMSPHFITEAITAITNTLVRDWDSARGVIRRKDAKISSDIKLGVLRLIAGFLQKEGKAVFSTRDWERCVSDLDLGFGSTELLGLLEEETGLLRRANETEWQFLHQSIFEYFAALYYVDQTTKTMFEMDHKAVAKRAWQFVSFFASDLTQLLKPRLEKAPEISVAINLARAFSQKLLIERSTVSGVGGYIIGVLESLLKHFSFCSQGDTAKGTPIMLQWSAPLALVDGAQFAEHAGELLVAVHNCRDGVAGTELIQRASSSSIPGLREFAELQSEEVGIKYLVEQSAVTLNLKLVVEEAPTF